MDNKRHTFRGFVCLEGTEDGVSGRERGDEKRPSGNVSRCCLMLIRISRLGAMGGIWDCRRCKRASFGLLIFYFSENAQRFSESRMSAFLFKCLHNDFRRDQPVKTFRYALDALAMTKRIVLHLYFPYTHGGR